MVKKFNMGAYGEIFFSFPNEFGPGDFDALWIYGVLGPNKDGIKLWGSGGRGKFEKKIFENFQNLTWVSMGEPTPGHNPSATLRAAERLVV